MRTFASISASALVLLAMGGPTFATELPIPTKVFVVKPNKLVKLISKNHGQPLPDPLNVTNPVVFGATLMIKDMGVGGGTVSFALDASGWTQTASGFKYKGKNDVLDPNPKGTCRVVLLTASTIKAVCKDDGLGTLAALTTPFSGAAAASLRSGLTGTDLEYCAEAGGDEKANTTTQLKRKDAPAPTVCAAFGCDGHEFAGGCWYADDGLSCDQICANQGMSYSELTRTVAGSDGSVANCQALIAHFGWPQPFNNLSCNDGFGCARDNTQTAFCSSPTTNSTATCASCGRICACE